MTIEWLYDLTQRMWRQGYQVAVPIFAAVVASGAGNIDPRAVIAALASAEAVTLFKFILLHVTEVEVDLDSTWWRQVIDRVLPAVAGVYLGVPLSGLDDFVATDWVQVTWVALAAGVLAAGAARIDPASTR